MMKKLWLACLMVLALAHPLAAADAVYRLGFAPADAKRLGILKRVLGQEFIEGVGVFPPEVLVAEVDLNGDREPDMVAVQKGFCSNHACTFHFLLNDHNSTWREAAAVESWAIPYVLPGPAGTMSALVVFDHLTDDCLACSEPKPVLLEWQRERSEYVETGPVPENQAAAFKPTWSWQEQR